MPSCRRALGGAALGSGLRHNSRSRRGRLIGRAAEIKARPVLRPRLWIAGGGFRIGTFRLLVLIIRHGNLLWGFVLVIVFAGRRQRSRAWRRRRIDQVRVGVWSGWGQLRFALALVRSGRRSAATLDGVSGVRVLVVRCHGGIHSLAVVRRASGPTWRIRHGLILW